MNLRQLRKLVNETVRSEQRKTKRRNRQDWNQLTEAAVRRVLREGDDPDGLSDKEEVRELQRNTTFEDVYGGDVKGTKYGTTVADQMAADGEDGEDNKFLKTGKGASDAVEAKRPGSPVPAKNLKPTQSEVKLGKSLGFAVSMIRSEHENGGSFKPGGDLGGIVSKEGDIFDGHHRWAGTFLVDPSITCTGAVVDLPKEKAIPVLRAIGIAVGHDVGNFGGGDSVWEGGPVSLEKFIEMGEKKMVDYGSGQNYGYDQLAPGAKKHYGIADLTEENKEDFWKKIYANYEDLLKKKPSGVPDREEMPVLVDKAPGEGDADEVVEDGPNAGKTTSQVRRLDRSEVDFAVEKLAAGEIDTNRFFDEELAQRAANESNDYLKTALRWHKLAGLLKD